MSGNSSVILSIGNVDLTNVALCGKVTISTAAVYAPQSFRNVLGQEKKTYLGDSVHIRAAFEDLPKATVQSIQSACADDTVEITFLNPDTETADFERPSVTATISYGDEEHEFWDITIEADCPLLGDGL